MATEDRHRHLLAAASAVVEADGWSALTMTRLAREAGVSRRLIYEHFNDRAALIEALLRERLAGLVARRDAVRDSDLSVQERIEQGLDLLLTVPRAERAMIRILFSGGECNGPEFERLRVELREEMIGNWVGIVQAVTGLDQRRSEALTWALLQALWGFADAIDDGRISVDEARQLAIAFITGGFRVA